MTFSQIGNCPECKSGIYVPSQKQLSSFVPHYTCLCPNRDAYQPSPTMWPPAPLKQAEATKMDSLPFLNETHYTGYSTFHPDQHVGEPPLCNTVPFSEKMIPRAEGQEALDKLAEAFESNSDIENENEDLAFELEVRVDELEDQVAQLEFEVADLVSRFPFNTKRTKLGPKKRRIRRTILKG